MKAIARFGTLKIINYEQGVQYTCAECDNACVSMGYESAWMAERS